MKKVRKGVFETNSSSMHSIVITEDDDKKYEDYKSRNLSFRDVFETEEDFESNPKIATFFIREL